MTVKKQENGKWLVNIDRAGVKRKRKSFESRKEAEIFEREYLDSNKKNILINEDRRTLSELINIWYRHHGYTLSDGKHRTRQLIAMAEGMGNPIASQITPEQFLDYRFKRTVEDDKPIAAKTFNNIHTYINAIYNRLFKLKMIDYHNPIDGVDQVKVQERQLGYLSLDEIDYVLNLCKTTSNESVWWIVQICIRTGARWGEAENITKKQLHNESITFEFTKSKKIRTVALASAFFKELLKFCKNKSPNQRIFTNSYYTFTDLLNKSDITFQKGQKTQERQEA